MRTKQLGVLTLLLGVLLCIVLARSDHASIPETLPAAVQNELDELRKSLQGFPRSSADAAFMVIVVKQNREKITSILDYAKTSPGNADLLAEDLFAKLNAYAERFKPGIEIDEQILNASQFAMGTEPDYGLCANTYLLVEITKIKKSSAFYKRVFNVMHAVMLAKSYFAESKSLYKRHQGLLEVQETKTVFFGGVPTTTGAEIAWCCEQFMADAYRTKDPSLPAPAQAVIAEYWQWREKTLTDEGFYSVPGVTDPSLSFGYQFKTMAFVKKLADAIPKD